MLIYHVTLLRSVTLFSRADDAAIDAERMLQADKANAARGIIKWKYIRGYLQRNGYLQRRGYEATVIDAVRCVVLSPSSCHSLTVVFSYPA